MSILHTFQLDAFLDTVLSLVSAFVLGTLIGAERQHRQSAAGLRTNVLVAVGAAAFTDLALRVGGNPVGMRVVANVVTGVGFLGAGVIMKDGLNIRGLNTAATLWSSAAVGCAAGADMLAEALLLAFIVIAGNTVLRRVADGINRFSFHARPQETTYSVRLVAAAAVLSEVRAALTEQMTASSCALSGVAFAAQPGGVVEMTATAAGTDVPQADLDALVARLAGLPGVISAAWESVASLD